MLLEIQYSASQADFVLRIQISFDVQCQCTLSVFRDECEWVRNTVGDCLRETDAVSLHIMALGLNKGQYQVLFVSQPDRSTVLIVIS